jgi:NAD(P)-dependent dehydrogenase (short-subunit alcohol dehydrogenase family)
LTGLFQTSQDNSIHGTRNEGSELESLSLATFDRAVALNLRGALVTLQAAVPAMKRQGADAFSLPLPSR